MDIQKYHGPTDGPTDGPTEGPTYELTDRLTWVGARDTCVSKKQMMLLCLLFCFTWMLFQGPMACVWPSVSRCTLLNLLQGRPTNSHEGEWYGHMIKLQSVVLDIPWAFLGLLWAWPLHAIKPPPKEADQVPWEEKSTQGGVFQPLQYSRSQNPLNRKFKEHKMNGGHYLWDIW